jgi:hypothetical protein
MKRKVIIFAVVFAVFLFASCDNDASGTGSESPVAVVGVSLNLNSLALAPEATETLTAVVTPDGADKSVTWTSSAPGVATVDNGTVTGVTVGNATITVTTADGNFTDTCAVTVHGYFDVANPQAWNSALASISDTEGGTADQPTVFIINITGNFDVAGINSGGSITGYHKEVRLTGSGTVSLGNDSDGNLIWTAANQTFIIDGPTLQGRANNDYSIVRIQGGTVELRNGYIKGNALTDLIAGGGVYVDEGGNFMMTGGEINGNSAQGEDGVGGGVFVYGNFEMTGGKISGNIAGSGGGVCVDGTFTMTDGDISGNEASWDGGGVYVDEGGNFMMTGGEISSNHAGGDSEGKGGGVYADGGNFTMSGGKISSNSTGNVGGGVFIAGGTFTMTGGEIRANNAGNADGGGVFIEGGDFKMTDGDISGNETYMDGGGVYVDENSSFEMSGGKINSNSATLGGGVYVYVGSFTVNDGEISGNNAYVGGGVHVTYGNFTMNDGDISGNTAYEKGGGVYFCYGEVNSTFTMTGSTIYGNEDFVPEQLRNNAELGAAVYIDPVEGDDIPENNTIHQYPPSS